jgi:hypothetical protein
VVGRRADRYFVDGWDGGFRMIATMSGNGVITITAENGAEAFALRNWMEKAQINVDDVVRALSYHVNPTYLMIDANSPEERTNDPARPLA